MNLTLELKYQANTHKCKECSIAKHVKFESGRTMWFCPKKGRKDWAYGKRIKASDPVCRTFYTIKIDSAFKVLH